MPGFPSKRAHAPIAGRRVLITGGSSGIGQACARQLTGAGARVALLARGETALREAARSLSPAPITVAADVSDPAALAAAVNEAAKRLGGIDAVVANAGAGAYGPFAQLGPDDYRRTIETTLVDVMNTTRAALGHLEASDGTLVVVTSVAARVPVPWLATYAAAKHGVRGFARSLQAELRAQGKPVRIAMVAPGPADTPFWQRARTPDRRLPPELRGAYTADDVAAEVVRALRDPRTERTVGGLMAAYTLLDALAPNIAVRLMGPVAKLDGGLRSRPSLLRKARDLAGIGR